MRSLVEMISYCGVCAKVTTAQSTGGNNRLGIRFTKGLTMVSKRQFCRNPLVECLKKIVNVLRKALNPKK